MKSEEKIPWKCSLILCHSKASYKRATGTREENYNIFLKHIPWARHSR